MNIKKERAQAKLATDLLKAFAHEARFMILCDLSEGERTAGELQEYSRLSQSAFSQHLGLLREKGLVKARKRGLHVLYSIADDKAARLLEVLHEIYCCE